MARIERSPKQSLSPRSFFSSMMLRLWMLGVREPTESVEVIGVSNTAQFYSLGSLTIVPCLKRWAPAQPWRLYCENTRIDAHGVSKDRSVNAVITRDAFLSEEPIQSESRSSSAFSFRRTC